MREEKALRLFAILLIGLILIFLVAAFASRGTPVVTTYKEWNLTSRFAMLSRAHTNLCALPTFIGSLDNSSYIQGACCSAMNFSSYAEQVTGLRNYSGISLIPPDPYNVSVLLAKTLLNYQNLTLTSPQQAVYDNATTIANPCCCRCWRWYAFEGLGKYLIVHYNFNAKQVARIWELEDGCGGPLNSPGFNPAA